MKENTFSKYFILVLLVWSFNSIAQIDSQVSNSTNNGLDEGEAHIAINPVDSMKMVLGYMEIPVTGVVNFKIFNSHDGGDSWQASLFEPVTVLEQEHPDYILIGGGDIVFAYDNTGKLYCSWITLWADNTIASPFDSCVWLATWAYSDDNGINFNMEANDDKYFGEGYVDLSGYEISVYDYKDGVVDRQWMSVDLSNGPFENNLYIGYIHYPSDISQTGLKVKIKADNQNSFSAAQMAFSGSGQLTNIGTDSQGVLHYSFADVANNKIYHVSSSDGGQTFSSPHLIYNGENLFPTIGFKINNRENAAPSLAIDGEDNLHLVWGDFINGDDQPASFYSKSTNGGLNWDSPIELETIFGDRVYMPVVSAKGEKVSIGGNVLNSNNESHYEISLSDNMGGNFSQPVVVSSGLNDFDNMGFGPFLGDYSSSVRTECNIYSLWTDCSAAVNGCKLYIAKYDQCANVGVVELTPVESDFSVQLYPNPAKNNLNITLDNNIGGNMKVEIYSLEGKLLLDETKILTKGSNNLQYDISKYKIGFYLVRFQDENGVIITRKFSKI